MWSGLMGESMTDRVYEHIKTEIITCAIQPGQQIAQPQLAEKYGMGTTPVREALQRLAQEGLVQPIPRFGYIVTPITFSDVTEMYELRSVLESAAARLAAERATSEQFERIRALAAAACPFTDRAGYSRFLAHNTEFHRAVGLASGNSRLADAIARLFSEMARVFHLRLDPRDTPDDMRAEHEALAAALAARDADAAERLVRGQIAQSQQRVLEVLVASPDPGASAALRQALHLRPA
jgi:DNA-binding GntR family transcriptional regulator